MTTSTRTAYEIDFAAWTFTQADLLRQERFDALDVVNVIEELETLGRSEYRALESALARLTQHLLKWQDQAGKRSKSWLSTIRQQRRQIAQLLRENPSFKARLAKAIAESYSDGWSDAAFETELPLATFPDAPTWNQLTKDDCLPES